MAATSIMGKAHKALQVWTGRETEKRKTKNDVIDLDDE